VEDLAMDEDDDVEEEWGIRRRRGRERKIVDDADVDVVHNENPYLDPYLNWRPIIEWSQDLRR
jgi:hypothetical protein